jgi:hypothetical protein
MTTRLANISLANTKSRSRDFLFACFIALTAVVSVASIGTAVSAATAVAQR